ncbi:MAG: hypothetical protein IJA34_00325 [Lachnospiraceae bacterium]|nr:hypothetical protein [Lachnospiraceae bacterium]
MDKLIERYNFTLWATIVNQEGRSYQYMDAHGINILINEKTKEFSFEWCVPKSIFSIKCPTCSPYDKEEHFDKMYNKFLILVLKVKKCLQ